ncbi:MAG: tetratricopeptide repeat protein [Bacteroidia bacterium]
MKIIPSILLGLGILLFACNKASETQPPSTVIKVDSAVPMGPAAQLVALNKQIELSPKSYQLFEERSRIYYQLDSLPKATADLDKAIALFPKGADLFHLRGFYAFVQNDSVKAMADYKRAAQLGTENPENYYQMGQLFFFQGNDKMALSLYQQAESLDAAEPIYIFAQGFLHEKRNNKQLALREYLRSLEVDSSFAKTRLQLHDLYLDGYNNELAAVEQARELLLYHPTHPLGRFYMGNYHMRRLLGMTDRSLSDSYKEEANEAAMHFSIALNRSPQFTQAYYNRGFVYFLAQNIDKALEDFQEVIKIDPQHQASLLMLGDIFYNYQDMATAKSYYERAIAVDPNNPDIEQKLAELEEIL